MIITGIVAEYNPLHKGHAFHIAETKMESDYVVAVMSGCFTQRGEPAIFDKFIRTRMALAAGVDMVIELPVVFATASAERFADGAVGLIYGFANRLSFGCETTDLDKLLKIARVLVNETSEFKETLRQRLDCGESFAAARSAAVSRVLGDKSVGELLRKPNIILGVEYLKAILRRGGDMEPMLILRQGAGHDRAVHTDTHPSALSIRLALANGDKSAYSALPLSSQAFIKDNPVLPDSIFPALMYRLRCMSTDEIAAIEGVTEGLENIIHRAARCATNLEELITMLKSKRYARSQLSRILLRCYLGGGDSGDYIRVLGIRKESRELLSILTSKANLPIITQPEAGDTRLDADIHATDLYALLESPMCSSGRDFTQGLIIY